MEGQATRDSASQTLYITSFTYHDIHAFLVIVLEAFQRRDLTGIHLAVVPYPCSRGRASGRMDRTWMLHGLGRSPYAGCNSLCERCDDHRAVHCYMRCCRFQIRWA